MTDFSPLRSSTPAAVLEPADPGFADHVAGFNLSYTHSPEAVVVATDAAAIVETVRFARANGLPVRVLATGHGFHESLTGGIVIATSALDRVTVDPATRIASIGAGARWAAVVEVAARYGLAPVTGSASTVGAVGYLLGGGLGPLARSHGFSSDWVRGFTVVTGEGEIVEATAHDNPDLFWALRGGKGGLGVVTEVRIELVALTTLYGGSLMFDTADIEPVLRAWVDFTATAPADVTTSVAIMRFPPIEQVPPPLRGKTLLSLRFAYPGDAETGATIAAPLRAVATPIMDFLAEMPVAAIASIHNDPADPAPAWGVGGLLTAIDQDFVTAILGVAGSAIELPIVAIELRHIGSATRADVAGGSAVGGRSADFTYNLVAIVPAPQLLEAVQGAATGIVAAIEPWIADETTINFASQGQVEAALRPAWSVEAAERLRDIRARFDPDGVFPFSG